MMQEEIAGWLFGLVCIIFTLLVWAQALPDPNIIETIIMTITGICSGIIITTTLYKIIPNKINYQ